MENQTIYLNNSGIIVSGSERMLSTLDANRTLFFTIKIEEIKELMKLTTKKEEGKHFDNFESFLIFKSYIEIHISNELGFLDETAILQIRKRGDDRGLNFFISKNNDRELTHEFKLKNLFVIKDEYYNELHIKTKTLKSDLFISITSI